MAAGQTLTAQWTTWTTCTESCFQGTRHRQRLCGNSDKNCSQVILCNKNACERRNQAFIDTACNATCNNTGWLKRSRHCSDPTKSALNESCATPTYFPCIGSCGSTAGTTHQATLTVTTTTTINGSNATTWIAVGASVGFLFLLLLAIVACVVYRRKKAEKAKPNTDGGQVNQVGPDADRPDDLIEEAYAQTNVSSLTTTVNKKTTDATNNNQDSQAIMVDSIIYSPSPENAYNHIQDRNTPTTPVNKATTDTTNNNQDSQAIMVNSIIYSPGPENSYDHIQVRNTPRIPVNNESTDITKNNQDKQAVMVDSIIYTPSPENAYDHAYVEAVEDKACGQLNNKIPTIDSEYDTTDHVHQKMTSTSSGYTDVDEQYDQATKDDHINTYDSLHATTTLEDRQYNTTSHKTRLQLNNNVIDQVNQSNETEYDVPTNVVDENANVNNYEVVTGHSGGYSSLNIERQDVQDGGYNQLQHQAVAAAYDLTE